MLSSFITVTFASLQWSSDCSKLALIAEEKTGSKKSYFDEEGGLSLSALSSVNSVSHSVEDRQVVPNLKIAK